MEVKVDAIDTKVDAMDVKVSSIAGEVQELKNDMDDMKARILELEQAKREAGDAAMEDGPGTTAPELEETITGIATKVFEQLKGSITKPGSDPWSAGAAAVRAAAPQPQHFDGRASKRGRADQAESQEEPPDGASSPWGTWNGRHLGKESEDPKEKLLILSGFGGAFPREIRSNAMIQGLGVKDLKEAQTLIGENAKVRLGPPKHATIELEFPTIKARIDFMETKLAGKRNFKFTINGAETTLYWGTHKKPWEMRRRFVLKTAAEFIKAKYEIKEPVDFQPYPGNIMILNDTILYVYVSGEKLDVKFTWVKTAGKHVADAWKINRDAVEKHVTDILEKKA